MATVYKIEVKATSPWINYTPEAIERELMRLLRKKTKMELENTTIKVERIA